VIASTPIDINSETAQRPPWQSNCPDNLFVNLLLPSIVAASNIVIRYGKIRAAALTQSDDKLQTFYLQYCQGNLKTKEVKIAERH
jgi:hypothetical protein